MVCFYSITYSQLYLVSLIDLLFVDIIPLLEYEKTICQFYDLGTKTDTFYCQFIAPFGQLFSSYLYKGKAKHLCLHYFIFHSCKSFVLLGQGTFDEDQCLLNSALVVGLAIRMILYSCLLGILILEMIRHTFLGFFLTPRTQTQHCSRHWRYSSGRDH